MSQYKISLIVPCYNVEKYVRTCLDSILEQTMFKDIEVIVVDDGSTDRTWDIIQTYDHYRNFVIYRQPKDRLGQYQLVNDALKKARGEYFTEIDSDDWIEPNFCKRLYNAADNQDDFVYCGYWDEYADRSENRTEPISFTHCRMDLLCRLARFAYLHRIFFLPPALYRKEFIVQNFGNFYREGTSYDDVSMSFKIRTAAKSFSSVDKPLYHYRRDNMSSGSYTGLDSDPLIEQWTEIELYNAMNNLNLESEITVLMFYSLVWQQKRLMVRPLEEQLEFQKVFATMLRNRPYHIEFFHCLRDFRVFKDLIKSC